MPFWTYMLRCADGQYYVGQTDNLERRLGEHQSGHITGFTYKRRPVELVWSECFQTRIQALEVERQIKGWRREKKDALIEGNWALLSALSKSDSASR